jgi:hypothetical protein
MPLDKRFKLRKTGQAKYLCLFTREEFFKAERIMMEAYGIGEPFYPGRYRKYENVPNRRDWFYSFKASNKIGLEMTDFKIYFRREEQKTFLTLAMA